MQSILWLDVGKELQKEFLCSFTLAMTLKQIEFCYNSGRPSRVSSFEVTAVGADQLEVQWRAPRQTNGKILGYRLTYREGKRDSTVINQSFILNRDDLFLLMTDFALRRQ